MDLDQWTVHLGRKELRGRTFLLGNKRAFSLSLPAATGSSDVLLHPHKWFGAYHYGRKFLEAQVVRIHGADTRILGGGLQTGFRLGLTTARREYEVSGITCSEEYFVPDGVQGFACRLEGTALSVEPELDMRYYCELNHASDRHEVELDGSTVLVWAKLPGGRYDDATESFIRDGSECEATLWAAIGVVGDEAWAEMLPERSRIRRKLFPKDLHRLRLVSQSGPEARDHAPLWNQSASQVYAPTRLHLPNGGVVVYGFGSTREEALAQLDALSGNLTAFQAQKTESAREILDHAALSTGSEAVDAAYAQVLTRLMDALVARHVTAEDTPLDRPATMILAGNQYFHDSWKRDENIALGFLLSLGFYNLARDIIRDTWQLQDEATGRLPQRIRTGEEPQYHSSDGTLWALIRLYQYWRCSGDELLLLEKLPMVERFFHRSLERTIGGLLPSGRTTDSEYLWETWMDTPHTPRDGFPVEIQMLWIAALRHYRPVMRLHHPELEARMETAEIEAWQALQRFNMGGFMADSLDEQGGPRELITPNPYFCFGLGLDLGLELEQAMRAAGRKQLAGSHGIRTLSPNDWGRVFSGEFLSDWRNVRGRRMRSIGKFNYHRGVEWNWLARFFVEAELKYGDADAAFQRYLRPQVRSVLTQNGIGGISELHDLSGARGPEYQAWSMSGFLEAIHAFSGVRSDVPGGTIAIEPQLPSAWPQLEMRKWYGTIPFDVSYRLADGSPQLEVTFPWGQVPDARMEISLILPPRASAEGLEVQAGSDPQSPEWVSDSIPGTSRRRVRVSLPAHEHIRLSVRLRKQTDRLRPSA